MLENGILGEEVWSDQLEKIMGMNCQAISLHVRGCQVVSLYSCELNECVIGCQSIKLLPMQFNKW